MMLHISQPIYVNPKTPEILQNCTEGNQDMGPSQTICTEWLPRPESQAWLGMGGQGIGV